MLVKTEKDLIEQLKELNKNAKRIANALETLASCVRKYDIDTLSYLEARVSHTN